jgi:hypothetical protein
MAYTRTRVRVVMKSILHTPTTKTQKTKTPYTPKPPLAQATLLWLWSLHATLTVRMLAHSAGPLDPLSLSLSLSLSLWTTDTDTYPRPAAHRHRVTLRPGYTQGRSKTLNLCA